MPSYTDEQKEAAPRMLEECGGPVTRAMRRLGYPSRQAFYQWINQADASHARGAGRPWSHYGPALKDEALRLVGSGTGARDVAGLLGVPGAAVVHNWARKVGRSSESRSPCADRRPVEPVRDARDRAHDGLGGDLGAHIDQLELENDMLGAVAKASKAEGPGPLANGEKTLVIEELRAATGRTLREPAASLRI